MSVSPPLVDLVEREDGEAVRDWLLRTGSSEAAETALVRAQSQSLARLYAERDFGTLFVSAIRMRFRVSRVLGLFPEFLPPEVSSGLRVVRPRRPLAEEERLLVAEGLCLFCSYHRKRVADVRRSQLLDTVLLQALLQMPSMRDALLELLSSPNHCEFNSSQRMLASLRGDYVPLLTMYRSRGHHMKVLVFLILNAEAMGRSSHADTHKEWIANYLHWMIFSSSENEFARDLNQGITLEHLRKRMLRVLVEHIGRTGLQGLGCLLNDRELNYLHESDVAKLDLYIDGNEKTLCLGLTWESIADAIGRAKTTLSLNKPSISTRVDTISRSVLHFANMTGILRPKPSLPYLEDILARPTSEKISRPSNQQQMLVIAILDTKTHFIDSNAALSRTLVRCLLDALVEIGTGGREEIHAHGGRLWAHGWESLSSRRWDGRSLLSAPIGQSPEVLRAMLTTHIHAYPILDAANTLQMIKDRFPTSSMICERIQLLHRLKDYETLFRLVLQQDQGKSKVEVILESLCSGEEELMRPIVLALIDSLVPKVSTYRELLSSVSLVEMRNVIAVAGRYPQCLSSKSFLEKFPPDTPYSLLMPYIHRQTLYDETARRMEELIDQLRL